MTFLDDLTEQHRELSRRHENMPIAYYAPGQIQQIEADLASAEMAILQLTEDSSRYLRSSPEVKKAYSELNRVSVALSIADKFGPALADH